MKYPLSLKNIYLILSVFIFATISVACTTDFDNNEDDPDTDDTNRTILVYMAAANSLSSYDNADLKEMTQIGKTGKLKGNRLIVFHQNTQGNQVLKEINLRNGNIDTLKQYSNSLSSLSKARMSEVVADTKILAPANDYGLVLWSHGNGWQEASNSPDKSKSGISTLAFGEDRFGGQAYYMDIKDLSEALGDNEFSFIYFDACYMGSVEVMYEMRNTVKYIVASAAETIVDGMPYDVGLPYLFAKGEADLEGAIDAIYHYVDTAYLNTYHPENSTGTYALVELARMDALARAVKDVYMFRPSTPVGFSPQPYMYQSICYYFDLEDILRNLEIDSDADDALKDAFESARAVALDKLTETVVFKRNTESIWPGVKEEIPLRCFSGLSTYFLKSKAQSSTRGYNKTSWWEDVAQFQFEADK